MKSLLILLGSIILTFFFASTAFAQSNQGLNLTTSPVVINLVAKPGTNTYADLRVHNNGSQTQHITVGLLKFTADGTTGKPLLVPKKAGDDYFNWVKFSTNSIDLGPDEWKTVRANFNIPKTAAFGYYYAVTFTQGNVARNANEAITGSSAILVLLDVQTPGEKKALEVTKFTTDKSIYEFVPVTFNVLVKNSGTIHVVPQGDVFIMQGDVNSNQLATIEINPGQGNVLPKTSRLYSVSWNDGFPSYGPKMSHGDVVHDSKGNIEKGLQWDFTQISKLRIGKYSAKVLLVYNDGSRDIPIVGTVSFWIIPWRIIGGAVIVGLIVAVGLFAIIKGFIRAFRK